MPPSVTVETRTGRTRIPRSRSLVVDILRLHQRNLTVAHNRYMQLAEVADARSRSPIRISWSALFIKAWAEVSSSHPILRQTWRDWPWGHIFQHRESVATLAVIGSTAAKTGSSGDSFVPPNGYRWSTFNPPSTPSTTLRPSHSFTSN